MVPFFLTLRFLMSFHLVLAAVATGLKAPTAETGFAHTGLVALRVAFLQAPLVHVSLTVAPFVTPCTVSDVTRSGCVFQKRSASAETVGGRLSLKLICAPGPPWTWLRSVNVPPTCT